MPHHAAGKAISAAIPTSIVKSPAEQTDDAGDPGTEDLTDPDLLGALFGSIGNEAEKPKAGDEDGEDGESDEDLAGLLLGVIQFIKVVIHEAVAEG